MVSELAYQGKKPTFEEAIALYNSGDPATARGLFEALLIEEPLSVPLLVSLGMSCWQLGDFRNAEDYLEKAIAIQPRNESAFRALGMLYNSTNNLEKAMKAAGQSPEIHRYDAAHAFSNERSEAYDVKSANAAWERMLPFLKKHL